PRAHRRMEARRRKARPHPGYERLRQPATWNPVRVEERADRGLWSRQRTILEFRPEGRASGTGAGASQSGTTESGAATGQSRAGASESGTGESESGTGESESGTGTAQGRAGAGEGRGRARAGRQAGGAASRTRGGSGCNLRDNHVRAIHG